MAGASYSEHSAGPGPRYCYCRSGTERVYPGGVYTGVYTGGCTGSGKGSILFNACGYTGDTELVGVKHSYYRTVLLLPHGVLLPHVVIPALSSLAV